MGVPMSRWPRQGVGVQSRAVRPFDRRAGRHIACVPRREVVNHVPADTESTMIVEGRGAVNTRVECPRPFMRAAVGP